MIIQYHPKLLRYNLLCRPSSPCIQQILVLQVLKLNTCHKIGYTNIHHCKLWSPPDSRQGRYFGRGDWVIQRKDISPLQAIHGFMYLSACIITVSKASKRNRFTYRKPCNIQYMAYYPHLLLILGIPFHIFAITPHQRIEYGRQSLNIGMFYIGLHYLGHSTHQCISVKTLHHLLMHDGRYLQFLHLCCPSLPLGGG